MANSSEFLTLQEYSCIPPWVDESDLGHYSQAIFGGTHGDEREQIEFVSTLQAAPDIAPPDALPVITNRVAADQGIRYVGDGSGGGEQLQAYYPGNPHGASHEDRVAASVTWLIGQLAPNSLVVDRHDNTRGDRYASFGRVTTPAAIAAGYILGHDVATVAPWSRFMATFPHQVTAEEAVPQDHEQRKRYLEDAIGRHYMISLLGSTGLTELYFDKCLGEQITFYEAVGEVALVDFRTGVPNQAVLGILDELEACPVTKWGEKIGLSANARQVLGLHPDREYCASSDWGYKSHAAVVDNPRFNLPDNKQRRTLLGTILAELPGAPMQIEQEHLIFNV